MNKSKSLLILICFIATVSLGIAQENIGPLDPLLIDLDVSFNLDESRLNVIAKIDLQRDQVEENSFYFMFERNLKILSATGPDGQKLYFTDDDGQVYISIPEESQYPFELILEYQGIIPNGSSTHISDQGIYLSWVLPWYPYGVTFEGLIGTNRFTVPDNLVIASQGELINEHSHDRTKTFEYEITTPSYYSILAAPFSTISKQIDGIDYRGYFLSDQQKKSELYFNKTQKIISTLSDCFGDYPYPHFSIVEVPAFPGLLLAGTSEQGIIALPTRSTNSLYLNIPVIAHEISHMWWGNWTIGDTFIMSEGLAQLGNFLAIESLYGEEIMRKYALYGSKDHFSSLVLYLTRYAESNEDEPDINTMKYDFDQFVVLQGKGPTVLLMLRDKIGKSAFYKAFANATRKYAHKRMTLEQLKKEFELAADRNLDQFFDQWFTKPGAPRLKLDYSIKNDGSVCEVSGDIIQTREPYYSLPIEILSRNKTRSEKKVVTVNGVKTPFSFKLDFLPTRIDLDPLRKSLWISEQDRNRTQFARAMAFRRDQQSCISELEDLIANNPKDYLARFWLAFYDSYFREDTQKAFENLSFIVEHADPSGPYEIYYPRACFELAKIYQIRGEKEKAKALFEKTAAVDRTERFKLAVAEKLATIDSQ